MYAKLYNLPPYKPNNLNLRLLRIIVDKTFTRIDFGYQATDYYIHGGWANIYPETFLRIKDSGVKLNMQRAVNIPQKPEKHDFESTVDNLHFSLFFPPLPDRTLTFDLIESEPVTPTLFNYYNVKIDQSKAIPVQEKL